MTLSKKLWMINLSQNPMLIKKKSIDTKASSTSGQFLKHDLILTNKILKKIKDVDKEIPNTHKIVKKTESKTNVTDIANKIEILLVQ